MPQLFVSITASARTSIIEHLCAAYPNEGCGALIGIYSNNLVLCEFARALRNTEPDPAHAYRIDSRDLAALERDLAASPSKILGYFHSHPDAPARPSRDDLEMAQGAFALSAERPIYLIASVRNQAVTELRAWQLNSAATNFEELEIQQ